MTWSRKTLLLILLSVVAAFWLFSTKSTSNTDSTQSHSVAEEPIPLPNETSDQVPNPSQTLNTEPPLPSKLPILVIGTLVHSDSNQSITALYFKNSKQTDIYVNKSLLNQNIQIENIERGLVYFKNLQTHQLEFLKLNENDLDPYRKEIMASGDVQQVGKNSFSVKKNTIAKYTNDLSKTLLAASVLPHKNSLGEVDGFQFVDLLPMGIFSQLGFQRGDIIKTVNGDTIDSLQKAIETYNNLKNSTGFKIGIERGGKPETFDYRIP
jgi:general secretion pathway protein C